MRNKFGRGLMNEFVGLRPKIYSYGKEKNEKKKNAKGTKKMYNQMKNQA